MIKWRVCTQALKIVVCSIFVHLFLITGQYNFMAQELSCCPKLTDEKWSSHQLYDGIVWMHAEFDNLFDSPQYLNLIISQADTLAQYVVFAAADSVQPDEKLLRPSEFDGYFETLAVINGGFFTDHPTNVNTGIFKREGAVYPFLKQESEEIYFVGEGAVGLNEGGEWIFYKREGKKWPDDWPEAYSAIAGGHSLIQEGSIRYNILSEDYKTEREIRHAGQRHPRTAICLTEDNHIILLVADGRHFEAAGFSLFELARLLQEFGCFNAINLDGGGSSTMFIRSEGVVNHPSDNGQFDREGERAVRTVIVVTEPEK